MPKANVIFLYLIMELLGNILQDCTANLSSIHGISHWKNVEKFAIFIAQYEDVNLRVMRAFAYFHDCKRENDEEDPGHGPRAAEYVEKYASKWLNFSDKEIWQLSAACRYHTADKLFNDITVLACYDCDRLDLPRIGIKVDVNLLYTETAKFIAEGKLNLDMK